MANHWDSTIDAASPNSPVAAWSPTRRGIVSALLIFHGLAIWAGAWAANPSSQLEQAFASSFGWYHQLIDQGYSYRYYAPEPGPTAIVTATVSYADGRPETVVRLPERGVSPRLRYQRQLALANHLVTDFNDARRETGDGAKSVWARSCALHLARTIPGSSKIVLHTQAHLIPDPARVAEAQHHSETVDIDAEEFYTTPERIGEFACDAF